MRGSRCVPLALLIAASGVVTACDQAGVGPLDQEGYTGVEPQALLSVCTIGPSVNGSKVIGIQGGSVEVGSVTMTVPAGAVSENTEFRVHVPSSPYAEAEIRANGRDRYQFLAPVVISLDYSRCNAPAGQLDVWHIDPKTKSLLENMGGVNDAVSQRMTFSTMHLSGYAIAN